MKLATYVLRRLVSGAVTVLGVATICFALVHALPGDPTDALLGETATAQDRAALRRVLRLDEPLPTQYAEYLRDLSSPARGMGRSFRTPELTVFALIRDAWPRTCALALCAAMFAWALALPLSLLAASRAHTGVDTAVGIVSLAGVAIPSLWLGPILILVFCVALPWLPFPGPDATGPAAVVLPALSLGLGMAGILTRMGRSALLETLREPYVLAARARGVSSASVLLRHALRPALVPLLTVGGGQLAALLSGAIVTEKIFERRGLGLLLLDAVAKRDIPVMLGCVVVSAVTAVGVQLAVDLGYLVVDPRVRLR
jgi:ABC-type dipeptide/oligopeptide/nickel transport system permease component